METIDYASRKDLVEALKDARSRGVLVEVVGNGRTLKFPNGIDSIPEDEVPEEPLVPPVQEEEPDTLLGVVEPPPAEKPASEGLMRNGDTLEESLAQRDAELAATPEPVAGGTSSEPSTVEAEQPTPDGLASETEGTTSTGDSQEPVVEQPIANVPGHETSQDPADQIHGNVDDKPGVVEDEVEDLIGAPPTPKPAPVKATKSQKRNRNRS